MSILMLSFHLRLGVPKGLFPVDVSVKILKEEDKRGLKILTVKPTEERLLGDLEVDGKTLL